MQKEKYFLNKILYSNKIISSAGRIFRLMLFFLFLSQPHQAQINLVKNPSFEELDSAVTAGNQIYRAKYWDLLEYVNTNITTGVCCGELMSSQCTLPQVCGAPWASNYAQYQIPVSGGNYIILMATKAGMTAPWNREYLITPLWDTLIAGKTYRASFFINLVNGSKYTCDRFGMYLDDGSVRNNNACQQIVLPMQCENTPGSFISDTLNWRRVTSVFTANGNESYITLGNFASDAQTQTTLATLGYPFVPSFCIDDVSIIPCDTLAYAGRDTSLCVGDSVFVGRIPEPGLFCEWKHNGTVLNNDSVAGFWFKSLTPGTHTLSVTMDNCTFSYDTVQITAISGGACPVLNIAEKAEVNFKLFPNPGQGLFNIITTQNLNSKSEIVIYDLQGKEVYRKDFKNEATNSYQIKIENLNPGLYFYHFQNSESDEIFKGKLILEAGND